MRINISNNGELLFNNEHSKDKIISLMIISLKLISFFSAMNNLLLKSSLLYEGVDLKFKSMEQKLDQKSFVLQATIDEKRGPIALENFRIYIDSYH